MADQRWIEEAERLLPCKLSKYCAGLPKHDHQCPAAYRPAVAQALQGAHRSGRLDEFECIKSERPINPTYWDDHHLAKLKEKANG